MTFFDTNFVDRLKHWATTSWSWILCGARVHHCYFEFVKRRIYVKCLKSKAPSRGGPEHKETHTPQKHKLGNYKCTWYFDNSRCFGDILEISFEERRVLNSQDHDSRSGGRVAPAGGSVCQLRDTTSVQSILTHTHTHTNTHSHKQTHTLTQKQTKTHKTNTLQRQLSQNTQ